MVEYRGTIHSLPMWGRCKLDACRWEDSAWVGGWVGVTGDGGGGGGINPHQSLSESPRIARYSGLQPRSVWPHSGGWVGSGASYWRAIFHRFV